MSYFLQNPVNGSCRPHGIGATKEKIGHMRNAKDAQWIAGLLAHAPVQSELPSTPADSGTP